MSAVFDKYVNHKKISKIKKKYKVVNEYISF